MNIVFLSHSPFHPSMVVGSHQLARVYASAGHRVLHISLPFSFAHLARLGRPRMTERLRTSLRGPHQVCEGLFEWIPITLFPWDLARHLYNHRGRNIAIPSARRTRKVLQKIEMESVDLVLQDEPRMSGMPRCIPYNKLIYRAVDLYAEMRGDPVIAKAETDLIQSADHVIATSQRICDHLQNLVAKSKVSLFANGFDANLFQGSPSPHCSLTSIPSPRIVYIGAIDNRFDFNAIHTIALGLPQVQLLIYGPGSHDTSVDWPRNVHWMGPLPYQQIPAVLKYCDVALLPFTDIPANHARSPMKYHEYRAAGLPVVAFRIESLANQSDAPSLFLYDSIDENGIVQSVRRAIEHRQTCSSDSIANTQSEHSWEAIGQRILELAATNV
ncbi:glycosyltransferase [Novipirellula sp. SH528]|uniref:glycosyltransferase n=1 Tax=Novipirellula sp. SH528 TaxID=3454466 RepID=UPI003FA1761E